MTAIADSRPAPVAREPIYVWEVPVRVTHWLIFFSVLTLSATGYYISHPFIGAPGPAANGHFVMGTVRAIHLYAAIVFSLAVLVRIYWMFVGNSYARLSQFIPVSLERVRGLGNTFLYFCFVRRGLDRSPGHDPLAGATYGLIFVVYLALIASGLALYTVYAPVNSPFQLFRVLIPVVGGLQAARLIHIISIWVILTFAVIHIYCVWVFSAVQRFGIADSIFSGYSFFPKGKADVS
jgi:Ni/Fe-hydrogenase 1 B-type cytochrome subunit